MSKPKTVILWGRDDVLRRAVELFLSAKTGWDVITVSDSKLLQQVGDALEQPDTKVVIIYQVYSSSSSEDEINLLLHLFQKHPGIKVITLNLENNAVDVYNRKKVYIKEVRNLLAVVEE